MEMINLYMDDERDTPKSFDKRTYTARETIEAINVGNVEYMSLDFYLGDDDMCGCGDGMDVLTWLEGEIFSGRWKDRGLKCPYIDLHSQHPEGLEKMRHATHRILKEAFRQEIMY